MRTPSRPRANDAPDDVVVDGPVITAAGSWTHASGGRFNSQPRASNAGDDVVVGGITGYDVFDAAPSRAARNSLALISLSAGVPIDGGSGPDITIQADGNHTSGRGDDISDRASGIGRFNSQPRANNADEVDEVEYDPYYGTDGADIIFDNSYIPAFYGGGGNDIFFAEPIGALWDGNSYYYPNDYFYGESGSDTVSYVLSDKKIVASLWTGIVDRILDGLVQSTDFLDSIENLNGSNYNDVIDGSAAANELRGGGGNDTIYGLDGNDHLWGDSGNDTLNGGNHNDVIDGGSGNDVIDGGSGNDTLIGGSGDDTIDGSGGIDTVVYTGSGDVNVYLWPGYASGAWGSDTLIDIERVQTGGGNDVVYGNDVHNLINVGAGNDTVLAFDGLDTVYAGSGNDLVYGNAGNDLIYGGTGNDTVWGGSDSDTIYGEGGNDRLKGEGGNDFLFGDAGADRIRGGDGMDTIDGGSGADVIEWHFGDNGMDYVAGFNLAQDRLWFNTGYFELEPGGAVDLTDVLMVFDSGDDAVLAAYTADEGWTEIAMLYDVDAYALGQMIENDSILGPAPVNLGGGPGGFELQ